MLSIKEAIREIRVFDDEFITEIKAQKERIRIAKKLGIPESMHGEFSSILEIIHNLSIKVCNETVKIGRILITKVVDFINENPKMVIGGLIGCAVALVVGVIPIIGTLIAPFIPFIGASLGAYLDKMDRGDRIPEGGLLIFLEGASETVKRFFKLVNEIISAYIQEKKGENR